MDDRELEGLIRRLKEDFDRLNRERFGGEIGEYKLRFSHAAVRTHGTVNFRLKKITVSLPMYEQHGWDAVTETLLHEMTHAYLKENGHQGRHTRLFWRELLARGGTREKKDVKPKAAYVYACPTCGREIERMRRLKQPWRHSCGRCDGGYNPMHRLYLKKDKNRG